MVHASLLGKRLKYTNRIIRRKQQFTQKTSNTKIHKRKEIVLTAQMRTHINRFHYDKPVLSKRRKSIQHFNVRVKFTFINDNYV